jgi:hypothetical protein
LGNSLGNILQVSIRTVIDETTACLHPSHSVYTVPSNGQVVCCFCGRGDRDGVRCYAVPIPTASLATNAKRVIAVNLPGRRGQYSQIIEQKLSGDGHGDDPKRHEAICALVPRPSGSQPAALSLV